MTGPERAPVSGESAEDQPCRNPARYAAGVEPVPVPADVLAGIEAVRRSGRTNMLDRPAVARLADRLGFPAAALWVHYEPRLYAKGVFLGFRAEPEQERDRPAGATHQTTATASAEGEDPRGADADEPRDPGA